jgi:hypothetical protein
MSTRLGDRLSAARQRRFAGRTAEIALFREALTAHELPFVVLAIYGPGGIGKTTLIAEYVSLAAQNGLRTIALDARLIDPSPAGFAAALQQAMGLPADRAPEQVLDEHHGRIVLTIDTYELLAPLDAWLRDEWLPRLSADTLVVLAGREPLSLLWRTDPGWQPLVRTVALRNLNPTDTEHYLGQLAIPHDQHQRVVDFTHGHPLALSLVADLFAQRPGIQFQPEEAPDMIRTLLELFVQKVPGPAHRAVLEICALVNITTEPLLAAMLELPEAHELFEWLRGLSLIDSMRQGIYPHDLAREALSADLRWRNPQWYRELHRRAREYYSAQLQRTQGAEQQQVLLDYIYLHRTNPVVRPFYEWQQSVSLQAEQALDVDLPEVLYWIQQHEGVLSAECAELWIRSQPEGILVLRELGAKPGEIAGALVMVALERTTAAERAADHAVAQAYEYLHHHAPLRTGQRATYFRYWFAREGYQAISPIQTVLMVQIVRHYLITPQLAYTFFPVSDAAFWAPLAAYADLKHLPEADFQFGALRFGVFGHDWRITPPTAWLGLLAERELATDALAVVRPVSVASQPTALSEESFLLAAEAAIQQYLRPDRLYGSPLLRSQLVEQRVAAQATTQERIAILQSIIREVGDLLQVAPRELRLYRAVYHTYIQPAATQEQAAELLDLPFSTYRRHLKQGLSRMAALLWQAEVGTSE